MKLSPQHINALAKLVQACGVAVPAILAAIYVFFK